MNELVHFVDDEHWYAWCGDETGTGTIDVAVVTCFACLEAAGVTAPKRTPVAPETASYGKTTEEFGVRYCDGEVEYASRLLEGAQRLVEQARSLIADGTYDAADYEPMTVVRRVVTVYATDWEAV